MSLSDLASLGSFVSGIAVLASLIYLTLQVRQAERYQKAIAQQARAARLVDWQLGLADSVLQEVLNKGANGDDDISLGQLRQYGSLFRAGMFNGEDTFILHKAGLISDDVFDAYFATLRTVCARAGWRATWKEQRASGGNEYREFIDQIVAEAPVSAPVDELANWRAAVGAERNKAAN